MNIYLCILVGIIAFVLVVVFITWLYNKATEKKFKQERIRRLLANIKAEEIKDVPFEDFNNTDKELY